MWEQIKTAFCRLTGCVPGSQLCVIDKSLTPESTIFILFTFIFFTATFFLLRQKLSHPFKRFGIMGLGVMFFELFTAPMWNSYHLGRFGYYYLDLSWVPTLCWTSMFMWDVYLVQHFFAKRREWQKFLIALIIPLIFTTIGELLMVSIGVRSYAPEVMQTSVLQIFGVPIEILYYAPVFAAFILSFYKFWVFHLEKIPVVPMRKKVTVRNFIICAVGVFLFELLIEPLIDNRNFPAWSYIYQDISLFRIGMWIVLIAAGTTFVDKFFSAAGIFYKFLLYIAVISIVFFQMESWLIQNGFRVYLTSASENFTGFVTPVSHIPIEIALAIPIYLILIIAFIRYWRIVLDNGL